MISKLCNCFSQSLTTSTRVTGWVFTPLMLAAGHGNLDAVKMLLDKGADVNAAYARTSRSATA